MQTLKHFYIRFRKFFFALPKSSSENKDKARREFILNILLLSSIFLSCIALVFTLFHDMFSTISRDGNSSFSIIIIILLYIGAFWLSKKGKARYVAFSLIFFYLFLVTKAIATWGTDTPVALLVYALLIVMSGILINSKFSLLITFLMSFILTVSTILNMQGTITFRQIWKDHPASIEDSVMFSVILFIIAIVSWLFNRESERVLVRARLYESTLKKERNLLEVKVEERTKEIRQLQLEKMASIYQFAEFGKLATGFFHDFSNSVNLVSLNLTELNKKNVTGISEIKDMIYRAQIGIRHMENFIEAVGKHVNNQNVITTFYFSEEINQVIEILNYKAKIMHTKIHFSENPVHQSYVGNPFKFHQLMSNLISNAIDSFEDTQNNNRLVSINLSVYDSLVEISITDNGRGISRQNMKHMFEPYFSTKKSLKGMGLGLSISNAIVINDLKGTVSAKSKIHIGTTVTVKFPLIQKNA